MGAELRAQRSHSTSKPTEPHRPTPDALDLLEQFGSADSVPHGCEIYGQGEPAEFCWQVLSGCVQTARIMGGRASANKRVPLARRFPWP
jgi:hypothetical protein